MRVLPESERSMIGGYRAIAELGEGAMGRVLLARRPGGGLAAVKRVHSHLLADKEFRSRFRSEVAACRKVDSGYAVPVIDADTEAAEPWFASAFTPGPTLAEVLAAGITLPEPAVLRLAAGLATALSDFAEAKVVHRDLKPSNILLAADGPRVLDFGIARAVDGSDGTRLTRTGWLVGTPAYMSPEQARAKPVTAASDVFSLGSVLVAAHTGAAPFDDPETLQVMYNVAHAKADLSGLPRRLRGIVSRCLAKDPGKRPDPVRLRELVGEPADTPRPWPDAVHDLIVAHHTELARLTERRSDHTTVMDAGETLSARSAADGQTTAEPYEHAAVAEPRGERPPETVEAGKPEPPVVTAAVAADPSSAKPHAPEAAPTEPKPPKRKRRVPVVVGVVLVAIAASIGLAEAVTGGSETTSDDSSDDTVQAADGSTDHDFADAYDDFEPDEPDSDVSSATVADLPDPCARVGETVAADFGLRDGDSEIEDGWKSCHWLATPSAGSEVAGVNLGFALGPYTDDEGGEPLSGDRISGATVHRDENPGSCTVQWPVSFGYILVTGVHDEEYRTEAACTLAADFAEAALPGLPD